MFPEDTPVPSAFLEMLATSLLRAIGKRPQLQVRTWLQELLDMSLLQGDFEAGFLMHDIVRQYSISRCPDVRQAQREVVDTLLNAGRTWPRVDRAEARSAEHYVAVLLSY